MEGVRMAVMDVTEDWSLGMENILLVTMKLVMRRLEMMMIQAQTGRKAATRPRVTALYDVCRRKKGVALKWDNLTCKCLSGSCGVRVQLLLLCCCTLLFAFITHLTEKMTFSRRLSHH